MAPEGMASRMDASIDAGAAEGLSAIDIGKSYRNRRVVKGVSLNLRRGEVVGLLGPNGAGKTTCFYMITGLIRVDQGQISIDGQDVTGLPMYQRARLGVGYLPQEPSIFRGLTVEQNVMAVVELVERDKSKRAEICEGLMKELRVDHLRDSPATGLSGGERRRVEIARSLATSPRFILLDEPFAGVDPIAVLDIQQIIRFLKERSIGVLITDHNVRETLGICDHAYIINQGTVLAFGKPQEIIYNEAVRKVYLGENFRL
jgi:lipopolysaccharide export system ATP-binding protein